MPNESYTEYRRVRDGYLRLFKRVDEYYKEHPDAFFEFNELNDVSSRPGLGLSHTEGGPTPQAKCIKVSTYFELNDPVDNDG
jgi:hypothetical protein